MIGKAACRSWQGPALAPPTSLGLSEEAGLSELKAARSCGGRGTAGVLFSGLRGRPHSLFGLVVSEFLGQAPSFGCCERASYARSE